MWSARWTPTCFSAVVHHIVGQQISTKAQATIWARMRERLGEVNARTVAAAGTAALQSVGISLRKAEYIQDFAGKVNSGAFDLQRVAALPDSEAIEALVALKGGRRVDGGDDPAVLPAAV